MAFAVGLSACSHKSSGASGRQVVVHTAVAIVRPVPRIVSAVGDVGRGLSPVISAPIAGRLTDLRVTAGESVAGGSALASLQPGGLGTPPETVYAPAPGTITQILVPAGMRVPQGKALFGWTGASARQARVPFAAALGPQLYQGQPVLLHSPLAPRSPVTGTIARLVPDTKHHALYAVITLPPRHGWVVGSPVRADVVVGTRPALVVPKSSIALRSIGSVVYVLHDQTVRQQRVTIKARLRRLAIISSGLAPGATVVTDPGPTLANGSHVTVRGSH